MLVEHAIKCLKIYRVVGVETLRGSRAFLPHVSAIVMLIPIDAEKLYPILDIIIDSFSPM